MGEPEPNCCICGVFNRHSRLYRHGTVYLCKPCEDKADEILVDTPPGTPYADDLRAEDAALDARG